MVSRKKLDIKHGLHLEPLEVIPRPSNEFTRAMVQITGTKYVGSYNWMDCRAAKIMVPGSPPRWLERETPFQVKEDAGHVYVDQNAFRMKSMPLLPLFKAIDAYSELAGATIVDWAGIDFVTDRNNLRKLLRWIGGGSGKGPFRIDAQLAGKGTVLLNCWNPRTRVWGAANSYGFSFEKASTTPVVGCENTSSHHRLVEYDLGGLRMVVRCEVDACELPVTQPTTRKPSSSRRSDRKNNQDDQRTPASQAASKLGPSLDIVIGGSVVPQSSLIEIKTVSEKGSIRSQLTENYPQLFLGQTPHLYRAIHRSGQFYDVEKTELGSRKLIDIAEEISHRLHQVVQALHHIKGIVVKGGADGRLSLVLENRELKVFKRSSTESCLPREILARFEC